MEEMFGDQLRDQNFYDKEFEVTRQIGYTKDGDNAELIFLERYYHLGVVKRGKQDDFTESSHNYIDTLSDEELDKISDSSGFFKEDGTDGFRLEIGDIDSARKYILNYINDQDIFKTFEDVSANVKDCGEKQQDLMVVGDAIYNLKQARKLMPYDMDRNNPDFFEYLGNDYSNYRNIPRDKMDYMSQDEIALYDFLLNTKGKSYADNYIVALEDTINNRHGMCDAIRYVNHIDEGGFSIWDKFYHSVVL